MVLDLMGEDAATMNKQRNVMKWDAKKKKYTMQKIGKDGRVVKENAAGAKANLTPTPNPNLIQPRMARSKLGRKRKWDGLTRRGRKRPSRRLPVSARKKMAPLTVCSTVRSRDVVSRWVVAATVVATMSSSLRIETCTKS